MSSSDPSDSSKLISGSEEASFEASSSINLFVRCDLEDDGAGLFGFEDDCGCRFVLEEYVAVLWDFEEDGPAGCIVLSGCEDGAELCDCD
jgi:hypothetical protein